MLTPETDYKRKQLLDWVHEFSDIQLDKVTEYISNGFKADSSISTVLSILSEIGYCLEVKGNEIVITELSFEAQIELAVNDNLFKIERYLKGTCFNVVFKDNKHKKLYLNSAGLKKICLECNSEKKEIAKINKKLRRKQRKTSREDCLALCIRILKEIHSDRFTSHDSLLGELLIRISKHRKYVAGGEASSNKIEFTASHKNSMIQAKGAKPDLIHEEICKLMAKKFNLPWTHFRNNLRSKPLKELIRKKS